MGLLNFWRKSSRSSFNSYHMSVRRLFFDLVDGGSRNLGRIRKSCAKKVDCENQRERRRTIPSKLLQNLGFGFQFDAPQLGQDSLAETEPGGKLLLMEIALDSLPSTKLE